MPERHAHPIDYFTVLKRRKVWLIVPLVASALIGGALAQFLPPTYRSSATIAVQAPAVILELVPAWASLNREERLRALSQQLRSPTVLARVAQDEGLLNGRPIDVVMQELLTHISVEIPRPIARMQNEPELNAFEIVYRDRTALRAQAVTDRLAQVFTEEHSR